MAAPRRSEPAVASRPAAVVSLPVTVSDNDSLRRGLIDGRPAAVAELYERFAHPTRRVLARTLGSADELDDLVQETFLIVIRRCKTLRDPGAFANFVVGVAIRVARNELRKRAARRWLGLGAAPEPALDEPDLDVVRGVERVYAVLDRLSSDARIAFVLRNVEQYDLGDAAAVCGCSLATFKRRLAHAERRFELLAGRDPLLRELLAGGMRQ